MKVLANTNITGHGNERAQNGTFANPNRIHLDYITCAYFEKFDSISSTSIYKITPHCTVSNGDTDMPTAGWSLNPLSVREHGMAVALCRRGAIVNKYQLIRLVSGIQLLSS
jgi:hypothetical protein